MQSSEPTAPCSPPESTYAGDDYFGNPYPASHEQNGFEYMDRNFDGEDDIDCVLIPGYN